MGDLLRGLGGEDGPDSGAAGRRQGVVQLVQKGTNHRGLGARSSDLEVHVSRRDAVYHGYSIRVGDEVRFALGKGGAIPLTPPSGRDLGFRNGLFTDDQGSIRRQWARVLHYPARAALRRAKSSGRDRNPPRSRAASFVLFETGRLKLRWVSLFLPADGWGIFRHRLSRPRPVSWSVHGSVPLRSVSVERRVQDSAGARAWGVFRLDR